MRDYAGLKSALLEDLGIQGYNEEDAYLSDNHPSLVAKYALATSFYKKLAPLGSCDVADAAALKKFLAVNNSLTEDFTWDARNEAESCFYDYFRNHLNTCLGPHESLGAFDLDSIREGMSIGPGAAQKADSSTLHTKLFEGELSTTNLDLLRYYRAAIVSTGFWADAEMHRFQTHGITIVRGGKLFFAPKNAEISRTCCTEANLNMLIQKSICAFMEFRLGWYFGISLSNQPGKNLELARIGSLDGTFGTIDSTSASDSIGKSMLDKSLEPSFLKTMIYLSRSETAVLPNGEEVPLRMISTMGNAFTFPLQTIIFASAVRAVYDLMGIPSDDITQYGVFGDDIVVRTEAYSFLVSMLSKLGFVVNVRKSFSSGPFRESCGGDWFRGFNVRGVYVKSLEIPQRVYSLINRLHRWSVLHGIPLPATQRILHSWVRVIHVPPSESDDAGIKVPFKATKPRVSNSYWFEYRCHVRRVKRVKLREAKDTGIFQVEIDGKLQTLNQSGIAVSFLSGYLRRPDFSLQSQDDSPWKKDWSVSYSLRDKMGSRARYKIVRRLIPYWDYEQLDSKIVAYDYSKGSEGRRTPTCPGYRLWEEAVLATLANG